MRVLIVGGFGYLGARLSRGLRGRGHDVVIAGRRPSPQDGYETLGWDVLDSEVEQARRLREMGADVVVDLASLDENEALRDPDLALRVSAEGARRLLRAGQAAELSRFVFMSTFHVYGAAPEGRIHEDTPTKAAHPYAIAHLAGEGYCWDSNRTGGPAAVTLRMTNGYGCPVDLSVDRWTLAHHDFCRQAVRDGSIRLKTNGSQLRDLVWMEDVAQAVDIVMRAPTTALGDGVFNLGGDRVISIRELAFVVARTATQIRGREVRVEHPTVGAAPTEFTYSVERLRRLGYVPQDELEEETRTLLRRLQTTP